MSELVFISGGEIDEARAFEVLASVPAESLWLANFTSENTRASYRRAVGEFIAVMGLQSAEELYGVSQAHICSGLRLSGVGREIIAILGSDYRATVGCFGSE